MDTDTDNLSMNIDQINLVDHIFSNYIVLLSKVHFPKKISVD